MGLQHCKALQTAGPGNLKFQNFKSFQDTAQAKLPNNRPGKASLLNCRHCRPWLQNRLGRASAPTLQGFAKLQPSKGAKLQTWQGCKIVNLQGSNTAGPAPTLQDFPSKSANCRALARLHLANLPKFQHCRLPTCCKVCQTTNKAAKSKLQGSNTAGTPNCKAFQACQAVC